MPQWERVTRPSTSGSRTPQRGTPTAGGGPSPGARQLLALQQLAGNRAVSEMLVDQQRTVEQDLSGGGRAPRPQPPARGRRGGRPGSERVTSVGGALHAGLHAGYGSRELQDENGRKASLAKLPWKARPRRLGDLRKAPKQAAFFTGIAAGLTGRSAAWAPKKVTNLIRPGYKGSGMVNIDGDDGADLEQEQDLEETEEGDGSLGGVNI